MAQLRFTIGVPGAGSAARSAESDGTVPRMPRIEGGSAARQAEERRRNEEAPVRRTMPSIRLSAGPRPGSKGEVEVRRMAQDGVPIYAPSIPEVSSLAGAPLAATAAGHVPQTNTASEQALPPHSAPPLQTAAHRFKSLVRSLFGPGEN